MPIDTHPWRLRLLGTGVLLFLGLLVAAMWNLQVVHYQEYKEKGMRHSVRVVREPGLRGRILDTTGEALAENRASHGIAVYMAEVRQDPRRSRDTVDAVEEVLDEISERIGLERRIDRDAVQKHFDEQRFLPLPAWKDIDDRTVARYVEQIGFLPGVDLVTEPRRVYPFGEMACHLLGYVGRGNTRPDVLSEEQRRWLFKDEMEGREGLERVFNGTLRGQPQERLIQVDAKSYRFDTVEPPLEVFSGADITLSLHHRIQQLAEAVLGRDIGAICVVSPRNGDVLALASYPRYDLSRAVPTFGRSYYEQLRNDGRRPFGNKAISERYHPGSTFKPVAALAALQSGRVGTGHTEFCDRRIEVGGQEFNCTGRHGVVDLRKAIETSCNIYFYEVGRKIEYDRIQAMARLFGLGQKTGIGLPESAGQLPKRAEVRQRLGFFGPGITMQAAIGQGEITTTPLQMAMVTAAIANGGTLYRPRLVKRIDQADGDGRDIPPEVLRRIKLRPGAFDAVRQGMRSVIYGDRGTARRARVDGMVYAGKTGTAQFGRADVYRGWMIAFAPYQDPVVAVSVLIESTPNGSKDAADKMQVLMQRLQPWLTRGGGR